MLVPAGASEHEGFEPCVEDERGDGVDEVDFEEFDGWDIGECHSPGVRFPEVDLLEVLVELAFGEEVALGCEFAWEQGDLGEFGGVGDTRELGDAGSGVVGGAFREHVITAKALVGPEQSAGALRQVCQRGRLLLHHVLVEVGGPTNGLAGVADDEVKSGAGGGKVSAERLDAGGVAEVEAEDFQAVRPQVEVRFGRVTFGGVAGEPGGDDEVGTAAEEFDAGLVADFDPAAGEEGDAAAEIGEFGSFAVVEFGALRAELVVEVVEGGVIPFTDVAVLRFVDLGSLIGGGQGGFDQGGWWEDVGGGEDFVPAEFSDARLVELGLVDLELFSFAFADPGFEEAPTFGDVRAVDIAGGFEEA